MSSATVSSEANKNICEAFGCYAQATIDIEVQVGKQGVISLHLCKSCVAKFQDN
jgi:hypothetical protein